MKFVNEDTGVDNQFFSLLFPPFFSLEIIHHFGTLIFKIIIKLTGTTQKSDFNAESGLHSFSIMSIIGCISNADRGEEKRHKEGH